jgi:hypothetical protein
MMPLGRVVAGIDMVSVAASRANACIFSRRAKSRFTCSPYQFF